jgi:hypothetical protein
MRRLQESPRFAFPIVVLLLGAGIHLAALLGKKFDAEPLWTDVVFLGVDLVIAIGLITRRKWAVSSAMVLFLQQVVFQSYWAIVHFRTTQRFGVQALAALICLAMLLLLLSTWRRSRRA